MPIINRNFGQGEKVEYIPTGSGVLGGGVTFAFGFNHYNCQINKIAMISFSISGSPFAVWSCQRFLPAGSTIFPISVTMPITAYSTSGTMFFTLLPVAQSMMAGDLLFLTTIGGAGNAASYARIMIVTTCVDDIKRYFNESNG